MSSVPVDPYTQAHDAIVDALRQVDAAAWRLRQENPKLLRQALNAFHAASKSLAEAAEQQGDTSEGR